jgi:molecular chaperone GrpE
LEKIFQEVDQEMSEQKKDEKEIPVDYLEENESEKSEMESVDNDRSEYHETSKKSKKSREDSKKKLNIYKKKYEELNDQFLRFRAEFANYKKRVEREQIEYSDYLKGELVKKLLPVLDDFDHMMDKSEGKDSKGSILEGAQMIHGKFLDILKDYGVEKIESLGKQFDPQVHEALMMEKIDDETKNGVVINVYQEGYKLKDKLLRPSKVIVGDFHKNDSGN